MAKSDSKDGRKDSGRRSQGSESNAGTYVFDKESGKVVKVSDRIPGVSGRKGKGSPGSPGPCGRGACGRGLCEN